MRIPRALWIVPPVVAGAIVVVLLVRSRPQPARLEIAERVVPVRTLRVEPRTVVPTVIGQGTVQPAATWRGVAEVAGRVVEEHPRLRAGAFVAEGEVLIRIDDADAKLAITRLQAEIRAGRAALTRLDQQEANDRALLEVQQRALAVAERELERIGLLDRSGSATASELDAQELRVLSQRATVTQLENALRLVPVERSVLDADLSVAEVRLKEAERDLGRAVVRAPFACRIRSVAVERDQAVNLGQTMVEADGIDKAEVLVRLPIERARHLLQSAPAIDLEQHIREGTLWEAFRIEPVVRLRAGDLVVEWPARFARISELVESRTRSVGLIVEVDEPYRQAKVGERPALLRGMFVEVELRGAPLENRLVVPRAALHDGSLYVVSAGDRLAVVPVRVEFTQFEEAVIAEGLEAGARVVLTDLIPAIEGTRLEARAAGDGDGAGDADAPERPR